MLTLTTALVASDSVGLDPAVWGPGVVLVALILSGVLVPGYLWRQERDERKRLTEIVEKLLPALEKSADVNETALAVIKDASDLIRDSRRTADPRQS